MRKKNIVLLLLIGVAFAAKGQESDTRLLNLLDNVLGTTSGAGKTPSTAKQNTDSPTFSIINNTGFTIKNIFICQTNTENWGDNILNNPLYNGQSAIVMLNQPLAEVDRYNIRMVDIDGDQYSKYNVRIGEYSTIKMGISDFEFEKSTTPP